MPTGMGSEADLSHSQARPGQVLTWKRISKSSRAQPGHYGVGKMHNECLVLDPNAWAARVFDPTSNTLARPRASKGPLACLRIRSISAYKIVFIFCSIHHTHYPAYTLSVGAAISSSLVPSHLAWRLAARPSSSCEFDATVPMERI
jgi:hypothetical protein